MATQNIDKSNEKGRLLSEKIALKSRIQSVINTFSDLAIHEFRQEAISCFAKVFDLAETRSPTEKCSEKRSFEEREAKKRRVQSSFVISYDASLIQDFVSTIDWRKICNDYNTMVKRRDAESVNQTRQDIKSSALEEVLLILEGRSCERLELINANFDKLSWSHSTMRAAAVPVAAALYRVATSVEIDDGPSRLLMREKISCIISRMPSASFVENIIKILESRLRLPVAAIDLNRSSSRRKMLRKSLERFNFDEAQKSLDLAIWLCRKHPNDQRFGPALASCITTTFSDWSFFDCWSQPKSQASTTNITERTSASNAKIQRGTAMSIRHLSEQHDFEETDNDGSAIVIRRLNDKSGRVVDRAQLRDDLERRHRQTLQSLGRAKVSVYPLSKEERFVIFRESLLDSLLSILHVLNLNCTFESKHALAFRAVLSVACQRPKCPGASICAIASASARTVDNGNLLMMQQLWGSFVFNLTNDDSLRRYSDFVVEVRQFDDPAQCWQAIEQVVAFTLNLAPRIAESSVSKTMRQIGQSLLRAIAHMLINRKSVLSRKEFETRFSRLLTNLSLHFGDVKCWVTDQMPLDEKERVIKLLCVTGIVSFVGVDALNELLTKRTNVSTDQWPFPTKSCFRFSSAQLAPSLSKGLLSDETEAGRKRLHLESALTEDKSSPKYPNCRGICIMDILNEDIIMNIFSFFGHKRIVKLAEVCKEWQAIGQKACLWQQMYIRRWPTAIDDPFAVSAKNSKHVKKWKDAFVEKCQRERAIRSKFSSNGWKHRTCEYVGCTSVLRSQQQLEKHYQKHKDNSVKRKSTREKQEVAKAKKEEARKEATEITKARTAKAASKINAKKASERETASKATTNIDPQQSKLNIESK